MKLRILDFDVETRPLAYMGRDFTTGEITAIACCWHNQPKTARCWLLQDAGPHQMLSEFLQYFEAADVVTGHNIVRFDLPVINGALMEFGLPVLAPKMAIDTYAHLKKRSHISASMENMASMLGLDKKHKKVHMSNSMWREANRLTLAGGSLTRERVVGDVFLHMAMRDVMVRRNMLNQPEEWRP